MTTTKASAPDLLSRLSAFQKRRKFPDWQPKPAYAPCRIEEPTLSTIHRMLNLLDLEVTVGEWVKEALWQLEPADKAAALVFIERNSLDEQKHDQALRYLATYTNLGAPDAQAQALVSRWQAQKPSFMLAYALEMGVFMSVLPYLTRAGDMYCAKVSQWIADDEGVHVLTNRELANELKQSLTKEVCKLVVDTLAYIFGDNLQAERALRRLTTGKDATMIEESVPVTPAFFEQHDKRSVVY